METVQITSMNFEEEVLKEEKPVLLDFWAEWCGPCQMLLPVVEELAKELKDTKICKINVDHEPMLAQQFKVMSIPTLVVMEQGKVVNRSVGLIPKESIRSLLEKK